MADMAALAEQIGALLEGKGLKRAAGPAGAWRHIAAAAWRKEDSAGATPPVGAHVLLLCLSGELRGRRESDAFSGGGDLRLRAGSVSYLPAGHGMTSEFDGVATDLHVMISPALVEEAVAEGGGGEPRRVEIAGFAHRTDPRLTTLTGVLRQAMQVPGGPSRLLADGLALSIAALLAERRLDGRTPRRRPAKRDPARLRAALELIADEPGEALSIDRLAQACGMTRFVFARAFRFETGQSPHQYVMARRIERAVEMLTGGDAPIADIAYATGFSSQAHLTETLSRRLGVTPGRLRARARG